MPAPLSFKVKSHLDTGPDMDFGPDGEDSVYPPVKQAGPISSMIEH